MLFAKALINAASAWSAMVAVKLQSCPVVAADGGCGRAPLRLYIDERLTMHGHVMSLPLQVVTAPDNTV